MKRLLVMSVAVLLCGVAAADNPPADMGTPYKLETSGSMFTTMGTSFQFAEPKLTSFKFYKYNGQLLFTEDDKGKVTIEPGVTADDIAQAVVRMLGHQERCFELRCRGKVKRRR